MQEDSAFEERRQHYHSHAFAMKRARRLSWEIMPAVFDAIADRDTLSLQSR